MRMLDTIIVKLAGKISAFYIKMVYASSKVVENGDFDLLKKIDGEQFVITFWHGDSYSTYPILAGKNLIVVTTEDRRGDYISEISKCFGYSSVRIPDGENGGRSLIRINESCKNNKGSSIAVTLDGPLGPYHHIKSIPFILSILTRRRVVPISLDVKRKVCLKKRWDNYIIPLPFNEIELKFHDPIEVSKEDKENDFLNLKEMVSDIMKTDK